MIQKLVNYIGIAAFIVGLSGCGKDTLNNNVNGELDYSKMQPIALSSISTTTSSEQGAETKAATNTTPLAVGKTFRLYAFPKGVTDIDKLITTRTYTISSVAGEPVLDPNQENLSLPIGDIDIFLVGPLKHDLNEGKMDANNNPLPPDWVDVATPHGVEPHYGADLVSSKTELNIKVGANQFQAEPLVHRMALMEVVVKRPTDATYTDLNITAISVMNQTLTGVFEFNATGGAITPVDEGTTTLSPIIRTTIPNEEFRGTMYVIPRNSVQLRIGVFLTCKLSGAEVDRRMESGIMTEPLVAGQMNRFITKPYLSGQLIFRLRLLPWDDVSAEDIEVPALGGVLFDYSGLDAPRMIDGKMCVPDRSGNNRHGELVGNIRYNAEEKYYYAATHGSYIKVPDLGRVPEYTLELTAASKRGAETTPVFFQGGGVDRVLNVHLPWKNNNIIFDAGDMSSNRLDYSNNPNDLAIVENLSVYAFTRTAAQSDVAKQYDLCVSDISLNKDIQYIIGSNSNQQKFEMAHVMTAVGFEAAGYDLMLTGVKFIGVNSKNTLTLHNRTWSSSPSAPALFEAKIDSKWLNSEHIQTSNPWRDITPNDGYLMMLPQSHTDDMKLEFTFTGQSGQPGGTYTMQLNKIIAAGATTSDWKPGVKITYRLRLKTRPAVQINGITIGSSSAGSTTPVLNIITSTDDDLTFSWTASWLGMYRGTNTTINNPESNGYFTPFQTGVNNWANVKFFARNENKSTVADRTATITVSGKKSGVRTFIVTHKMKRLDGVKIGNLYWAKGNLVADGSNGCKIGAPSDYGLFFNFGSLVGWGNGTGQVGQVDQFASQRVTPAGYSGTTSYPAAYYTGGSPLTDVASTGIGDPCRYYLKGSWRTPTTEEQIALLAAGKGKWATNGGTNGMWFGINPGTVSSSVFFPASGVRGSYGQLVDENAYGAYWSSSAYNTNGYYMSFNVRGFQSQAYIRGNYSNTVRCVSTAP